MRVAGCIARGLTGRLDQDVPRRMYRDMRCQCRDHGMCGFTIGHRVVRMAARPPHVDGCKTQLTVSFTTSSSKRYVGCASVSGAGNECGDAVKQSGVKGSGSSGATGSTMCDALLPPKCTVFTAGWPVGQAFWNSALAMVTRKPSLLRPDTRNAATQSAVYYPWPGTSGDGTSCELRWVASSPQSQINRTAPSLATSRSLT